MTYMRVSSYPPLSASNYQIIKVVLPLWFPCSQASSCSWPAAGRMFTGHDGARACSPCEEWTKRKSPPEWRVPNRNLLDPGYHSCIAIPSLQEFSAVKTFPGFSKSFRASSRSCTSYIIQLTIFLLCDSLQYLTHIFGVIRIHAARNHPSCLIKAQPVLPPSIIISLRLGNRTKAPLREGGPIHFGTYISHTAGDHFMWALPDNTYIGS
ncbi:hypothetical protein B0H65DRAFT_269407 [Neurospora tetraspora]|uniref:Uncharacterized protein n=1 Tax=Neurospora tetraspora TaxID=94610 RepID=A0AAE0JBB1_9PEZI|nr:hypothetical protein B0H65DRAFT_269407 [Neurospora tetraspora]